MKMKKSNKYILERNVRTENNIDLICKILSYWQDFFSFRDVQSRFIDGNKRDIFVENIEIRILYPVCLLSHISNSCNSKP